MRKELIETISFWFKGDESSPCIDFYKETPVLEIFTPRNTVFLNNGNSIVLDINDIGRNDLTTTIFPKEYKVYDNEFYDCFDYDKKEEVDENGFKSCGFDFKINVNKIMERVCFCNDEGVGCDDYEALWHGVVLARIKLPCIYHVNNEHLFDEEDDCMPIFANKCKYYIKKSCRITDNVCRTFDEQGKGMYGYNVFYPENEIQTTWFELFHSNINETFRRFKLDLDIFTLN